MPLCYELLFSEKTTVETNNKTVTKLSTRLSHVPRTQVMACLLHGDAAFSGQGVVAETLQLSGMRRSWWQYVASNYFGLR